MEDTQMSNVILILFIYI